MKKKNRKMPEYGVWAKVKQRCHNPKCSDFKYYGQRGIVMDQTWINSFETFLADVGPRPSDKHTLDRTDNNKGYNKENCRWVSRKQQMNNTRANINVLHNGVTKTVTEWSEELGISSETLRRRLVYYGWTPQEALEIGMDYKNRWTKNKNKNTYLEYQGVTKTLSQWSRDLGINRSTLSSRLNRDGLSVEKAFKLDEEE